MAVRSILGFMGSAESCCSMILDMPVRGLRIRDYENPRLVKNRRGWCMCLKALKVGGRSLDDGDQMVVLRGDLESSYISSFVFGLPGKKRFSMVRLTLFT
jgi:hypothetical protein